MTDYSITINNKRIFDFYQKYATLDIESNNLFIIDLFENVFSNGAMINKTLSSQILTEISGLNTKMQSIQTNISGMSNELILKFLDIKRDYIEDMKLIITSNTNITSEKISILIDKQNSQLIDKTTLVLNEIIPRNQESQYSQIQDKLTNFYHLINADTKQILSQNNTTQAFQDFTSNFDSKYSTLLHTIQNASEERITKSIDSLKETSTLTQSSQEKTLNELSDFLSKYKVSCFKGQCGENLLSSILTTMFPSAEIINSANIKASCDFILKRESKDAILIENKDYERNVSADEVKKFIRDCDTQHQHGIFLSQHCGIIMKSNYQIEIHKGCILVYVHNVEYNSSRIQIAIDVIDSLSNKLKEFTQDADEENTISKEIVEDINDQYTSFISQKESMNTILRDFNKRMSNQIDNISIPALDKYLGTKFASTIKKTFNCDICDNYCAPTLKGLSAHQRACKLHNSSDTPTIANDISSKKSIKKQIIATNNVAAINLASNIIVATLP